MPSIDLHYFGPPADGSRSYINLIADPVTGEHDRSYGETIHTMEVEDIRGKEDQYTLDKNGFQLFQRPSALKDFTDDAKVREEYYPESIELIKELTGASKVIIFNHAIRRRQPGELQRKDLTQDHQPIVGVHADHTVKSATSFVHRFLPPSEASKLVHGRFQILNIWRPIGHAAFDWPIAFCDFNSVDAKEGGDCFATTLNYLNLEKETMHIKYNPAHKWKYVRGMTPDEFMLFKNFDSKEGVAKFAPHTSFEDTTTPVDAPYRHSIEIRALVFYD